MRTGAFTLTELWVIILGLMACSGLLAGQYLAIAIGGRAGAQVASACRLAAVGIGLGLFAYLFV